MTDELLISLNALKSKRAALTARFESELGSLDALIMQTEQMIRVTNPQAAAGFSNIYADLSVPEAVQKYLAEHGPAATRTIAEALAKGGVPSMAKDFPQVVYMALRGNPKLFVRKGSRWSLIAKPEPVAVLKAGRRG